MKTTRLLVVLAGCLTSVAEAQMRPMVGYVEKAKEQGPKLTPTAPLEAWLEASKGRVVRVPLSVRVEVLAREVKLGELPVKVDDSALGVSFDDRVRSACKGETVACRVWVEGRWADGTLKVLHFGRAVKPDEVADFVEREVVAPK